MRGVVTLDITPPAGRSSAIVVSAGGGTVLEAATATPSTCRPARCQPTPSSGSAGLTRLSSPSAIPAGFDLVAAVSLDLVGVTLAQPARLSTPAPASVAAGDQLLVAMVVPDPVRRLPLATGGRRRARERTNRQPDDARHAGVPGRRWRRPVSVPPIAAARRFPERPGVRRRRRDGACARDHRYGAICRHAEPGARFIVAGRAGDRCQRSRCRCGDARRRHARECSSEHARRGRLDRSRSPRGCAQRHGDQPCRQRGQRGARPVDRRRPFRADRSRERDRYRRRPRGVRSRRRGTVGLLRPIAAAWSFVRTRRCRERRFTHWL